jgi:tyrosinase
LAELVDAILENVRDLETFNDLMESIHDQIHGWIGGDMGDPTTAAFDPIFFAHHCMIDRIWYLWQIRHDWDRFPTALLDEPLIPFGKTVRQVLNVQELGYEYAADAVTIPLGG